MLKYGDKVLVKRLSETRVFTIKKTVYNIHPITGVSLTGFFLTELYGYFMQVESIGSRRTKFNQVDRKTYLR